jgi:hypothetical protein
MAHQRKPRIPQGGKPLPGMTRLKALKPEERAEIASWGSTISSSEQRARIAQRFGINLSSDSQLTRFVQWQARQVIWDRANDMAEQDEAALSSQFPQLSREKLREAAIKRSYVIADAIGNPALTMKVVKEDLNAEKNSREWQEFQRETCELFLKWSEDKRAQDIASAGISNADKIEQLGQLMFGEGWKK